mgnify:CR=1 FL=1
MPYFNTIHVNQPLTNVSVRYNWGEGIADKVFPEVPVAKESDVYFIYDSDNLRVDETIRANRAESNVVGMDYSTATYTLEEHALKELVSYRDRANADAPLNLDVDAAEHLTEKLLIRRELDVATLCFTTTTWANNATVGSASAWDTSTSNPIADVLTATSLVLRSGFVRPNRGVMGWEVMRQLKVNSTTTDRIKYTERAIITDELMASLFDLDQLLVGRAARVTSAEGAAQTTGFIWSKDMLVYHVPSRPSLRSPAAGYILTVGARFRTKKWREEKLGGDYIEVSTMFSVRAVATSAAYLLKQCVV